MRVDPAPAEPAPRRPGRRPLSVASGATRTDGVRRSARSSPRPCSSALTTSVVEFRATRRRGGAGRPGRGGHPARRGAPGVAQLRANGAGPAATVHRAGRAAQPRAGARCSCCRSRHHPRRQAQIANDVSRHRPPWGPAAAATRRTTCGCLPAGPAGGVGHARDDGTDPHRGRAVHAVPVNLTTVNVHGGLLNGCADQTEDSAKLLNPGPLPTATSGKSLRTAAPPGPTWPGLVIYLQHAADRFHRQTAARARDGHPC